MRHTNFAELKSLQSQQRPPCLSLYQPTHRHHPDNQQDPIRFRNLVAKLEKSLNQKENAKRHASLLGSLQSLADDSEFWNHRTDGLAIFVSPERLELFELQRPVRELAIVADSFHTKPLLRVLQSGDRYQILALDRSQAKLYEGNRYALDEVALEEKPATIEEALGAELSEPHLHVASYGAGPARAAGSSAPPSVHGHGDKKDEVDIDRDRFFRAVDRGVLEHHSRPSGLPLMLAALPEHHAHFRDVTHNPFLMDEGIERSPASLDVDRLREQAWRIVEPKYHERLTSLTDNYRLARSRELATESLEEAARAAVEGRVGVLLVEDDRQIAGKIDPASGELQRGSLDDPSFDDALDDLAELVVRMKGEVVVVPSSDMPSETGLAAIYRF
jgi:hypothetical protein